MEFAKIILKLTGSRSKIIFEKLPVDDPQVRQPDISRAKKLLKWYPLISVEEGLERTIKWFQKKI